MRSRQGVAYPRSGRGLPVAIGIGDAYADLRADIGVAQRVARNRHVGGLATEDFLRLVDRLMGPSIATGTARFLVVEHSDSASECGSNFAPILSHGDASILKVQHWLQTTGATDVSLAAMAERAGLEERTFLRRFRAATGLKPTEYCQHLRVGKAREMLEFTNGTIDHIAWTVGYQDPSAFRTTFRKITGLAPSDYRSRFGSR